jgi:hypothetical protein
VKSQTLIAVGQGINWGEKVHPNPVLPIRDPQIAQSSPTGSRHLQYSDKKRRAIQSIVGMCALPPSTAINKSIEQFANTSSKSNPIHPRNKWNTPRRRHLQREINEL